MFAEATPTFGPALARAFDHALAFLRAQDDAPVNATANLATLRERLLRPLNDNPIEAEQVIDELVRGAREGLLGSAGGRFFAWVIGGSIPAALAADWLTSTWDQNAVLYETSPAAALAEEAVGAWLKDLLALPLDASFALVTGCQMAHATCLAAARHGLLARYGWNVEEQGLSDAPPIRVVSSARRHASIDRCVRFLGFGSEHVDYLEPGADETMEPVELERALRRAGTRPTIVLLQAGDINTGAFDSFKTLIPLAKKHGAWVHVDGAFGLWVAASPAYRALVDGVAAADSWATDGHKWLNVPFDCGYAFVADAAVHRASMSVRAPYISGSQTARDQIDWTPEWSRRARGFPTYAALRSLGRHGVCDLIENTIAWARDLVDGIARLPHTEVLWYPVINQGLVRFFDDDRRTEGVIEQVAASGEAFFGPTTWRGKRAMRVSVVNWQTSERDVSRAISAIEGAVSSEDHFHGV